MIHAVMASTLVMAAASFMTKQKVSRAWLILCFPTVLATRIIDPDLVRRAFVHIRRRGRSVRPVVLVGANSEAQSIAELILGRPELGYRITGVVDDTDARMLLHMAVDGRVEDAREVARATGASGVIIATTAITSAVSNRLVRELIDAGIHVEMSSSLIDVCPERLTVQPLGTTPVLYIEPWHKGGWQMLAKRAFDIGGSAIALIVLCPLLALVALAIRLDRGGSVFFSQVRVGKDGKPFMIRKFRTMVQNAEELLLSLRDLNEADGPLFKLEKDPRVTRIGSILRRFSIDELPQLWR